MCNEVMCQRLCSTWEHYPKEGSTKGLPWLNWKEILFKNILAPTKDLNKINNNNKFAENASRM